MHNSNGKHPYYGHQNGRMQRFQSKLGIRYNKKQQKKMRLIFKKIEYEIQSKKSR